MSQVPFLTQYPAVRANSLGEITMIVPPDPVCHTIEFADSTNVHYAFHVANLDQVALGATTSSGHRILVDDPLGITLILPLTERMFIESGSADGIVGPGETAIIFPGRRRTISERGALTALAKIPARLFGAQRGWVGRPPLILRNETAVRRATLALLQEVSARSELPPARTIGLWEALVLDSLSVEVQPANLAANAASARQVKMAEEYIRANLSEPLSVRGVAGHIGVSSRALQLAFRRHRDSTPHRYIALQRAAVMHARLLAAGGDESVTSIMLDVGVASPGRFARFYRSVYGEAPSNTLAKVTGRVRSPA